MENHIYTLMQHMQDADPDIRRQSLIELARLEITANRQEVVTNVIRLLDDEHIPVREAAEEALVSFGGRDVVEALLPCLSGSSTTMLNYAIEILSRIGDAGIDLLLPILESKDHDIRKFGCDILGNLKYTGSVYDLIDLLNDPHVNVAIAAGEALGKIGHRDAVPYLIRALQHPDTWMRCIAAEALGKIGDQRAVDPFISMSVHEDPIVLYTVVKAMGNFQDQRVVPYILSILHSNPMFAPSASQAIENLANQRGASVYEEVKAAGVGEYFIRLLSSENLEVLRKAINIVGRLKLTHAVDDLGELFKHNTDEIVKEAIAALGEIASQDSISLLMQALDKTNTDEVRVEAVTALGKILRDSPELDPDLEQGQDTIYTSALNCLITALSDSCDALRRSAAEALGDIELPMLSDPLGKLLHDPSLDVREAASRALSKIRHF